MRLLIRSTPIKLLLNTLAVFELCAGFQKKWLCLLRPLSGKPRDRRQPWHMCSHPLRAHAIFFSRSNCVRIRLHNMVSVPSFSAIKRVIPYDVIRPRQVRGQAHWCTTEVQHVPHSSMHLRCEIWAPADIPWAMVACVRTVRGRGPRRHLRAA
jgi:hypothetical protein